ncbi:ADP-dependent glucokinase/phosphofructokinase [Microbacterium karelineae]|uniref:ADP-dependent glucokinase/phosphofructokinase n=1 Tax=Microbacterium karelineae TaxID=2654283 RepID=UPI0012EA877A|nr:ADP-dependent glucokinase/phosphofructokinase [Microbacterium karelineae]
MRVLLGMQGTVDFVIDWRPVEIERVAREFRITAVELDSPAAITGERSLFVALLQHFAEGRGGERFVPSSDVVKDLAKRFRTEVTLGGTCVRAALLLRSLGVPSLLHLVSEDAHSRRLLPDDCAYITSATEDTLDPHLIVQYAQGDSVTIDGRRLTAPSANRVIIANDPPASMLRLSPRLAEEVARADLFLVSGFNTIQDPRVLQERLAQMQEVLAQRAEGSTVVYEDAGFHDPQYAPVVSHALGPLVDVLSMNEDELQVRIGREIDLRDVGQVARAIAELREMIPDPTLVVHTRFWSVAVGDRAEEFAGAVDMGNASAGARFLRGDGITADDIREVADGARQTEIVPLARDLEDQLGSGARCLAAFDVRPRVPTTIGLGDTFVGGFLAEIALRASAEAAA